MENEPINRDNFKHYNSNAIRAMDIYEAYWNIKNHQHNKELSNEDKGILNNLLKKNNINILTNQPDVLSMADLVNYLKPYNLTRSSIDKWIMQTKRKLNNFPFHKKGKRLYFYKSEIDEWFRSKR